LAAYLEFVKGPERGFSRKPPISPACSILAVQVANDEYVTVAMDLCMPTRDGAFVEPNITAWIPPNGRDFVLQLVHDTKSWATDDDQ
jgi:hypothetical protein